MVIPHEIHHLMISSKTTFILWHANFLLLFYDFAHAGTYFKLEKRPEEQNMPRTMDAKLSKAFYRVTSIGTGNGEGLVKLQGQIATVVQKAPETEVNDPCESGDC